MLVKSRAAIRLKILIAINRTIKIFNRDLSHQNKKHKFVAQNNSIIHDITSIAHCQSQQNILTTEIKIKTSN